MTNSFRSLCPAIALGALSLIAAPEAGAQLPPAPQGTIYATHASGSPAVRGIDIATGAVSSDFLASETATTGGVRIATGDVNGDGAEDIVTGAGPGSAGGHVKVFDGRNLTLIHSFLSYPVQFSGGVFVAAGDINGNGSDDIIVGPDAGAAPQVVVYNGGDLGILASFFAFPAAFTGGVSVAAGDVNGDGRADIVVGAHSSGTPHIKVFSGIDQSELRSFFAFDPSQTGVSVGAADVNVDGRADILAGSIEGVASHVKVFSGLDLSVLADILPFGPGFLGGVSVAAADLGDSRGQLELLVATGSGSGYVAYFDSLSGGSFNLRGAVGFNPFGDFTGGLFITTAKSPGPTPSPTPTETDSPTPTETETESPTPSDTPTESPTPTPLPTPPSGRAAGDFDNSGCTDIADFLTLLDFWQLPFEGGPEIGIADFLALLDYWKVGTGCV